MDLSRTETDNVLVCAIIPYFLEKGLVWFNRNENKILKARKTQPFFQDNILYLCKNQKDNLSQILRKLDEMGYEKTFQAEDPGEFSSRGGIIDIFPINLAWPVRLEFLGNQIQSLQLLPGPPEEKAEKIKELLKKRIKSQKLFSDLKGLKAGDYLVHLDHGVARFLKIESLQFPYPAQEQVIFSPQFSKAETKDYYVLEYAYNDKLYVPVGLERKLSRYIGFVEPKISRLGSLLWQRTKRKIKEEAEKLAKEILEIYAKRTVALRSPYLPEDEIDFQLASTFKHQETPDQIQALQEIKEDLEKSEPMDRIVCGDVGFGKTEVALRAAVKAAKSGYQTALLCPTTILANQHFQNFEQRLKGLPIRIFLLSRLQTKKEQKKIIESLKAGQIDIVICTHRVLSNDLDFKNLGLLIIDDEQRFGVKQKEKLKKIRASLDVLSLSATPIPRTLYMALSSLKNISLIQTPPLYRQPIKTLILPWSEKIIKTAIAKELKRGGQVYYLHNRVETIQTAKKFLEKLAPKASFAIAHGRLKEKELLKAMESFQNKKTDVLIATTIIENGLDLPNANTLIVADATRLGLAQAYQIRGRIGRSYLQALAYFLYPQRLSDLAQERLTALKKAEELGSGYKIALKDLEIRGAGNILGREQSGNINRVGLNLYCQMLAEAIERLKTEKMLY